VLLAPAFIENGQLQQFDMIVANPPYSISQWNRDAFSADKYGRNFLGTPPQSRADYAFFQHILKSLSPQTGRCAILFPHGVLFRAEESTLRQNLIATDLVECVLGLGANLFYNSPMEACILICRTNKPENRRGKILLINAVNEASRKNAQSWLEDSHIKKIAGAYENYADIEGFSKVISIEETAKNGYSLSIPMYVRETAGETGDVRTAKECAASWIEMATATWKEYDNLTALLGGVRNEG